MTKHMAAWCNSIHSIRVSNRQSGGARGLSDNCCNQEGSEHSLNFDWHIVQRQADDEKCVLKV